MKATVHYALVFCSLLWLMGCSPPPAPIIVHWRLSENGVSINNFEESDSGYVESIDGAVRLSRDATGVVTVFGPEGEPLYSEYSQCEVSKFTAIDGGLVGVDQECKAFFRHANCTSDGEYQPSDQKVPLDDGETWWIGLIPTSEQTMILVIQPKTIFLKDCGGNEAHALRRCDW